MNILYITHCDPRLTNFGSAQRSHFLWEALKKIGTVYTVYNIGPNEEPVSDGNDRICSACFAPGGYMKLHLFAKTNSMFAPFVWPFRSEKVLRQKMPWKGVSFDKIVVRYLGNVALTNAWKFGSVYVDIDDLPYESYNTIRRGRIPPPFGRMGSLLVSWWQKYILRKCNAAWIASPDQVAMVSSICPCAALTNLPVPPASDYKITGSQKRQLMTVGLMSYEPNYEGVDWFVDNVWPLVHKQVSDLTYRICGGGVPERLRGKWSTLPGVEVAGFVKDIDKVYEESIAVVTPIWSGAGTCIKVPEAVLRGRKVFATPFAVRGLSGEMVRNLGIEVSDDAAAMTELVVQWVSAASAWRDSVQREVSSVGQAEFSQEVFASAVAKVLGV